MKISGGGRPTVLLVEDIGWIRSGMRGSLEGCGYRVVVAADDAEAVEVAERESPRLILTEEELPTFGALLNRVRPHPLLQNVPVVIVHPDAHEHTRYGDAVVLNDYEQLEGLLTC